jgi:hypothetical protein
VSSAGGSASRSGLSSASERDGLTLVEESGRSTVTGESSRGRAPSSPLAPLSVTDLLICLTFDAFLLTYLTAIGLSVRWVPRWPFGA